MLLTSKQYALTLTIASFALLTSVITANVVIDPQRMFGTGFFPHKTNENDRYHRYLDYRKTASRISGLFFASSRGTGIPLEMLSAFTGDAVYADFTVQAGMISDHLPVLARVIGDKAAQGERLTHVFLLLDLDLLGGVPETNRSPQTQLHPDLTGEDPVRFWIRYLTGIQFRAWRQDVRNAVDAGAAAAAVDKPDAAVIPAPVRIAALGAVPLPAGSAPRATHRIDYPHHLELLRRFVLLCRDHQVELIVATSPLNLAVAEQWDREDLAAAVADLSRIMPIWDFGSPAWLSGRPDLWRDNSHFTQKVGRMMLERIFGGASAPNGEAFGERRVSSSAIGR